MKTKTKIQTLATIEASFIAIVLLSLFPYVFADVGQEVTVITKLEVGESFPEVLNITQINFQEDIDLTANDTVDITFLITLRDFNGGATIDNVTAEFYDSPNSFYGDTDDNNQHYTNLTCYLDNDFGSYYEARANCTFSLWYYAYNSSFWNISAKVTDETSLSGYLNETFTINSLLAIGLPNELDYGTVNVTYVSPEKILNITNFGNTLVNISLSGYARTPGDNYSMNCSLGIEPNISIDYEKYNLSSTTEFGEIISLSNFEANYTNLSSESVIYEFNLNFKEDDTDTLHIKTTNSTYWRIYLPQGVGGNCTGNIVFGATQSQAD